MNDAQVNDAPTDLDAAADRAVRGMWTLFEPIHVVTYFGAPARAVFEAAGLRGFWRGYFAGRAAPLGRIGPAPVVALFHSFSPVIVARALPGVWELLAPGDALRVRAEGASAALRTFAPSLEDEVAALADRLWEVAAAAVCDGRALAAANAALPRPSDPFGVLWQAATTLREHRGDGHIAALVCAGVSGLEAIVLRSGSDLDRAVLQPGRGWNDQEWATAAARLVRRGLLDPHGRTTPAGGALLARVETLTDRAAASPWAGELADGSLPDLAVRLLPLARACAAAVPGINPIGLQPPWDASAAP